MMKQDEELWMKKMKEILKDYSEQPPSGGWNKLEKGLPAVAAKRIRPSVWWAAAAVLLLAISGITLFLIPTSTMDDIRQTAAPVSETAPAQIPATIEPEHAKVNHPPVASNRSSDVVPVDRPDVILVDVPDDLEREEVATESEPLPKEQADQQPDDRRIVRPSGKDKLHLPVENGKKSTKGRWALSASVSNVPSASTSENKPYLMMANVASDGLGTAGGMLYVGNNSLFFDDGVAYLRETALISEIKHSQPISFGLSVRRNLGHGFSVESGVTYTMLSSEGKSLMSNSGKIEQKLHYIGVPVRGNFDFVETKRFTAYAAAGGMVEKCVYGKIGSERHTVKPLQFSLSGGVGAQLNLTNRIGVYVEPGISYFFDDGSDVETIRKETPLNFNLQAGIRFTY